MFIIPCRTQIPRTLFRYLHPNLSMTKKINFILHLILMNQNSFTIYSQFSSHYYISARHSFTNAFIKVCTRQIFQVVTLLFTTVNQIFNLLYLTSRPMFYRILSTFCRNVGALYTKQKIKSALCKLRLDFVGIFFSFSF